VEQLDPVAERILEPQKIRNSPALDITRLRSMCAYALRFKTMNRALQRDRILDLPAEISGTLAVTSVH